MILHHSSTDYSYKLGDSGGYVRRNKKGFYIDTEQDPKYFTDFIFTSQGIDYYLITISPEEFVVYRLSDKIEKVLIIYSLKSKATPPLFNNVILKIDNQYVKITSDLNMANISPKLDKEPTEKYQSTGDIKLDKCDLGLICNSPLLYSLNVTIGYPYDGCLPTTFYFEI